MPGTLEDILSDATGTVALTSPRSMEVCRRHGILPEELYPRSVGSFVEYRGEMPEMVQRRYDHFNTRRLEKLNFLVGERRALLESEAMSAGASPLHADPQPTGRMSGGASMGSGGLMGSPRGSGRVLYGDSYEQEEERIAARMEREARKAQKAEVLQEMREQEQRQREMKLAWQDQRHAEALREQENAKLGGIIQNAGKKAARMDHVREQQQMMQDVTEHKKMQLTGKQVQKEQTIEERRQQAGLERERKREEKAMRAAQVRQRKEEMERVRVMHLEGRLMEKEDKTVEFERERLSQQLRRQQEAETKQQREADVQERMRLESERKVSHMAHKNILDNQGREGYAELTHHIAQTEQHMVAKKQRHIDDVKQKSKDLQEMRRLQAVTKLQEKEQRVQLAQEQMRQQKLWEANEKRLKMTDAKEAIERQKRKQAYEQEVRQEQVQRKMDRLLQNEEAKWYAVQQHKQQLEEVRVGGASTPRGHASPRPGMPRRNSIGSSRH